MSSNRLTVSSAGIVASLDFFIIDMKADIVLFRLPTTSIEQLNSVSTDFLKIDTCAAKSFALYLLFTLMEADVYLDLKNKKIVPLGTPKGIIEEQKIVSATLKAIKGFGKIVRDGGWVLEKTIGLWSKSKADLIRKYSREIADACEMLETGTKRL
ncbi:hypothetical protein ABE354_16810 [Brevibacillus laterosporus]|uniref:hypothetical protein n=1 Tax=Brevibacillus laterosporus TaxID=1465 RepID=UPI003D239741